MMNFFRAIMATFLTNILVLTLGLLINIITSRWLGTSGRGILAVSGNVISFILIILDMGIGVSNTYFIGKNKGNINNILGSNILIAIFECVIVLFLYIIGKNSQILIFKFIFKGLTGSMLVLTLATIPILSFKTAITNIILGMEEYGKYNKINIINQFINLILVYLSLVSFSSAIYVLVANMITMIIIILYILFILYQKDFRISFNFDTFSSMIRYGIKAQLSNLIQFFTYSLDIFIINYFLTVNDVGLYTLAVMLANIMWQIPGTISTLMYPSVCNSEDKSYIKSITNKTMRISIIVIFICCIGLALISRPLILMLFGSEFKGAINPLLLLIPGIAFFSISKILASSIAGMGRIDINLRISTIICLLTIILDFSLIPFLGINSASIATSITYIAHATLTLFYYEKLTGSDLEEILILNKSDRRDIKNKIREFTQL